MTRSKALELWVEPRLRGFVVTNDSRNPSSRVGEFLPYAAGWRSPVRQQLRVPGSSLAPPMSDVELRVATARAEWLASRAMARDLGRRLREGQVDHVVRQAPTVSRVVPAALALVAVVGAIVAVATGVLGWLVMTAVFGAYAWLAQAATKREVRTMRLAAGKIEIELADGGTISRPLTAIRGVRLQQRREIEFDDGVRVRFCSGGVGDRRLLRQLQREFARASIGDDRHASLQYYRLIKYLVMPLSFAVFGAVLGVAGVSTIFALPGRPFASGAYAAVVMLAIWYFWFEVSWIGLRIVAWSRVRDIRKKIAKDAPASASFRLVSLSPDA